jgi:nitroreductase
MNRPVSHLMTYLATRRSIPAARLVGPAPNGEELRGLLRIAARVPDHGKLAPWRFVVIQGDARPAFLDAVMAVWCRNNPDASAAAATVERGKRGGSPLIVAVVSCAGEHPKIPVWEQQLSAGAVCLNLVHAAHAGGYAAQWLTGWPAYDAEIGGVLGLKPDERIAGFIHIGTADEAPVERDRPDIDSIVTVWEG